MIFSVYHKKHPIPDSRFIVPIVAGEDQSWNTYGCLSDSTGDNIAQYNKIFSELTAYYWVWKNYRQDDDEIIGFSHYRRYFIRNVKGLSTDTLRKLIVRKQSQVDLAGIYTDELMKQFNADLDRYDFILPFPEPLHLSDERKIPISIKDQYIYNHIKEDWYLMEDSIKSMYPEYHATFITTQQKRQMRNYNMFICKRREFNKLCEWMFPLLFDILAKVTICEYPYQKRVISFMSERLFNLYIDHHSQYKIKNMRVLFIAND